MKSPRITLTESEIEQCLAKALQSSEDYAHPDFPSLPELLSEPPKPAAVLIPLLKRDGIWHVLFTRRNANLPEHSGQVAFPGGRSDPEDSGPDQTALREASEEIGLNPAHVRILGKLHDFLTITNYRVTPVVGVIPWPYPLRLAAKEVSRVFTVPLNWLMDPANHEQRLRELPAPHDPVSVIYFSQYDGEVLWGATARFTLALVDVLRQASQNKNTDHN